VTDGEQTYPEQDMQSTDPRTDDLRESTQVLQGPESEPPVSFIRWVGELALMVALAFALAAGIRAWIVQPYVIPSGSMIPTIELQDRVIANKFIYRFTEPERGDIVVLDDSRPGPSTTLDQASGTRSRVRP